MSALSAATGRKSHRMASAAAGLRADWTPLAALASDVAGWRDLVERAIAPNVFLEPAFAAAAAGLPAGEGIGVLRVLDGSRLVGLLPGRVEGIGSGRPVPTFVAWTHPYAPLSGPLVDREAAEQVVEAFIAGLSQLPERPRLLLLPMIAEEGAVTRRLADLLYRRGLPTGRLDPHRRAALVPQPGIDPLAGVSHGHLKELRRQRRRLVETGALVHATVREATDIGAAVETYLTLEAKGWKGREGSAAALDPAARQFISSAVAGLAREHKARVDCLTIDGKAIAASITLFSGRQAWFWKIAYDEAFARFSPGVQLTLDVTRALAADKLALVDSCAVAHHPMIDSLWSGRLALSDWLVALPGAGRFDFTAGFAAEGLRRGAMKPLKFLRDRLHAF